VVHFQPDSQAARYCSSDLPHYTAEICTAEFVTNDHKMTLLLSRRIESFMSYITNYMSL